MISLLNLDAHTDCWKTLKVQILTDTADGKPYASEIVAQTGPSASVLVWRDDQESAKCNEHTLQLYAIQWDIIICWLETVPSFLLAPLSECRRTWWGKNVALSVMSKRDSHIRPFDRTVAIPPEWYRPTVCVARGRDKHVTLESQQVDLSDRGGC